MLLSQVEPLKSALECLKKWSRHGERGKLSGNGTATRPLQSSLLLEIRSSLLAFKSTPSAYRRSTGARERQDVRRTERERSKKMGDWGPVVVAVALFVALTPGLLFQLPGRGRLVEFGNLQTSAISILVHSIIYFALITVFLIAVGVHITTG